MSLVSNGFMRSEAGVSKDEMIAKISAQDLEIQELKLQASGLKFTIGELQSKYVALKTETDDEANTAALQLKETRAKLDDAVKTANTLQSLLDAPPALISSPIGALPLNAEGFRRLLTHCEYLQRKIGGIEALYEVLRHRGAARSPAAL